jgi:hypothetical protein
MRIIELYLEYQVRGGAWKHHGKYYARFPNPSGFRENIPLRTPGKTVAPVLVTIHQGNNIRSIRIHGANFPSIIIRSNESSEDDLRSIRRKGWFPGVIGVII